MQKEKSNRQNIEALKKLVPHNPRGFYNSALIYITLGDKNQAIPDLKEGIKYAALDAETGLLMEKLIKELENKK